MKVKASFLTLKVAGRGSPSLMARVFFWKVWFLKLTGSARLKSMIVSISFLTDEDKNQGFGSGSGSGSAWIRINLSCWIRIRIQIADPYPDPGGKKSPTKIEKNREFSCFELLDVLF
jgi:hypothetical protein